MASANIWADETHDKKDDGHHNFQGRQPSSLKMQTTLCVYMYMCVYLYVYICISIPIYFWIHICVYVELHIYKILIIYIYILYILYNLYIYTIYINCIYSIYIHISTFKYVYCIYIYIYANVCLHVYLYISCITSISSNSKFNSGDEGRTKLTPKAGLTAPCSISPNSTVSSAERCILAKRGQSGVQFPLGAELERRKQERISQICPPVSPRWSPRKQSSEPLSYLLSPIRLSSLTGPWEEKSRVFMYCLVWSCAHSVVWRWILWEEIGAFVTWIFDLSHWVTAKSWKFVWGAARTTLATTSLTSCKEIKDEKN